MPPTPQVTGALLTTGFLREAAVKTAGGDLFGNSKSVLVAPARPRRAASEAAIWCFLVCDQVHMVSPAGTEPGFNAKHTPVPELFPCR